MTEFPTQKVLELACAAQRFNSSYIKEQEHIFDEDNKFLYTKHSNKVLMLCTLDPTKWATGQDRAPEPLTVLPEDVDRASEIKTYYKRLLFAAIDGENDFLTSINTILNSATIKENQFGYVACLPSVQLRDYVHNQVKKAVRAVEEGFLGNVGDRLADLDCEILEVIKSKNFTGWNVCAIINNKMVSWMSQIELQRGPCVVLKAKVKAQGKHWKHQNDETRLNFVKAMQ